MPVETLLDRSLDRVADERERTVDRGDAYAAFRRRVDDLSTVSLPPTPRTTTVGARTDSVVDDRCRRVRTAFEETVDPHVTPAVEGATSLEAGLGPSLATALAPAAGTAFTGEIKRTVLAVADRRRTEAEVLRRALDREAADVRAARRTVRDVTAWIVDADESPLSELGFAGLRRRHDALATRRERCETLVRDRQTFLRQSTSEDGDAGLRHSAVAEYLYRDRPVGRPVLATGARLDATCAACQRAVRDHLVRRV